MGNCIKFLVVLCGTSCKLFFSVSCEIFSTISLAHCFVKGVCSEGKSELYIKVEAEQNWRLPPGGQPDLKKERELTVNC